MQEKMQMQARQGAGLDAKVSEPRCVPVFPGQGDFMVAHIGWVADEGCHADVGRQIDLAIVIDHHRYASCPTAHAQVGAQHQRGKWIHFNGLKMGIWKHLSRCQNEAARAGAWIDDTGRSALAGEPGHH